MSLIGLCYLPLCWEAADLLEGDGGKVARSFCFMSVEFNFGIIPEHHYLFIILFQWHLRAFQYISFEFQVFNRFGSQMGIVSKANGSNAICSWNADYVLDCVDSLPCIVQFPLIFVYQDANIAQNFPGHFWSLLWMQLHSYIISVCINV
jgi:hypothetical protein